MNNILNEIILISREAGNVILDYYDDQGHIEFKKDESPLTKADLAAHNLITRELKNSFPDIPVISEESGVPEYIIRKHWSRFFLVDPMDGTKEFIKRNGEFTVNIALIEKNVPVIGVVHVPAKQITWYGGKELGTYRMKANEPPEAISHEPFKSSEEAIIVVSRSHGSDDTVREMKKRGINVKKEVPSGSSIKLCLVAEGTADLYPRLGPTMEWDTAAGDCIFRYSCSAGTAYSPLKYNKENMKNEPFILGLGENLQF
jgi:3'(2'), 5'-bisphosphate nucleotidase